MKSTAQRSKHFGVCCVLESGMPPPQSLKLKCRNLQRALQTRVVSLTSDSLARSQSIPGFIPKSAFAGIRISGPFVKRADETPSAGSGRLSCGWRLYLQVLTCPAHHVSVSVSFLSGPFARLVRIRYPLAPGKKRRALLCGLVPDNPNLDSERGN